MTILRIDRAFYDVNDETRTYNCYGRNPGWKKLSKGENKKNKKHIDDYTRIFPDGRKKAFKFK